MPVSGVLGYARVSTGAHLNAGGALVNESLLRRSDQPTKPSHSPRPETTRAAVRPLAKAVAGSAHLADVPARGRARALPGPLSLANTP